VATLRMMWRSVRASGYIAHDPFHGFVLPKLEEIKRIIESANEPYKTFYAILQRTLRKSTCGIVPDRSQNLPLTGPTNSSVWLNHVPALPANPEPILGKAALGKQTSLLVATRAIDTSFSRLTHCP